MVVSPFEIITDLLCPFTYQEFRHPPACCTGREDCALVVPQNLEPSGNIVFVLQLAVYGAMGAQERRAKLGYRMASSQPHNLAAPQSLLSSSGYRIQVLSH